jgi:hypothetical protein
MAVHVAKVSFYFSFFSRTASAVDPSGNMQKHSQKPLEPRIELLLLLNEKVRFRILMATFPRTAVPPPTAFLPLLYGIPATAASTSLAITYTAFACSPIPCTITISSVKPPTWATYIVQAWIRVPNPQRRNPSTLSHVSGYAPARFGLVW